MCFEKFVDSVRKRNKEQSDNNTYDFFSICEEIGETFSALRKTIFHGKQIPINYDLEILDECGDLIWFIVRSLIVRIDDLEVKNISQKIDELCYLSNLIDVKEKSLKSYLKELAICFIAYFFEIIKTEEMELHLLEDKFKNLLFNLMMILKLYNINFYDCLNFNIDKLNKRHGGENYNPNFYRS